jgi:hypothetical protein
MLSPSLGGAVKFLVATVEAQYFERSDRFGLPFAIAVGIDTNGQGAHMEVGPKADDPAFTAELAKQLGRKYRFSAIIRATILAKEGNEVLANASKGGGHRIIVLARDAAKKDFRVYGCKIRRSFFEDLILLGQDSIHPSREADLDRLMGKLPEFAEADEEDLLDRHYQPSTPIDA